MASAQMLENVKSALGVTGTYQDATLNVYIDEAIAYCVDAGCSEGNITAGTVALGVSDLWNYGEGGGEFSQRFKERVIQTSLRG